MTTRALPQLAGTRLTLSHFGLGCFDLDRLVDFYTRVLGMTETDRGSVPGGTERLVFLTTDPAEHHQLVLASGRTEGEIHEGPVLGGDWAAVYTRDPEGNALEFVVDSPWFVHQPFGELLDLDLDDAEILRQTEAICRATGDCRPYEEWREQVAARITTDQARLR
jgi:catechol 2,3-dioxygenase-like lactoylglutathione lyase family enzyme